MSRAHPVSFDPILKTRPWGGRRLASILGKSLPPDTDVGESWEISGLEGEESRVARGPLAGRTLSWLMTEWGPALLGGARPVDGRFPLLIKFLDARDDLSVQVHPAPSRDPDDLTGGVKHEAWYVVAADPGARLLVGARPNATLNDFARAASTPAIVDLLQSRPARPGQCFYLPSGVPHALGAGMLVAEVQTPSDTTYRLYDWDRRDASGKARELHVDQALSNLRLDIAEDRIVQTRSHVAGPLMTVTHLVRCERFLIDRLQISAGFHGSFQLGEMVIWIVLSGGGEVRWAGGSEPLSPGRVVLVPADSLPAVAAIESDAVILEVKIPVASPYAGTGPLPPEPRGGKSSTTPLQVRGKPRVDGP